MTMFINNPKDYSSLSEWNYAISQVRRQLTDEQIEYARMLFSIERFGNKDTARIEEIPPIYIKLVYNMGLIKKDEIQ